MTITNNHPVTQRPGRLQLGDVAAVALPQVRPGAAPGSTDDDDPTTVRHRLLARIAALPDDAWQACPACRKVESAAAVTAGAGVCSGCGHHRRMPARDRIRSLVDPGSFEELELPEPGPEDPLGFCDRIAYPDRLAAARHRTGLDEAVVVGRALIGGHQIVLAVMDFRFLGGSMGVAVGRRLVAAAQEALRLREDPDRRTALVIVATSGGARMQEGVLSLWQMARTASEFGLLREVGLPTICILSDPVYGGVAASFAALGDVIIAEPGARAGFAGPGVIADTIGDDLPPGFQTAEFLLEHGHVDLVVDRPRLPSVLRQLLEIAVGTDVAPGPGAAVGQEPAGSAGAQADGHADGQADGQADGWTDGQTDGWAAVQAARATGRPPADAYVRAMLPGYVELRGDRSNDDDPAVLCALGRLGGRRVAVIAQRKGRTVHERVAHRFGMAGPSGYHKAIRVARLAERWGIPVLTLVDTPGAFPGVDAEERNQSGAIAECLLAFSTLRVPVVCVVVGEGGSGGALALAVSDRLYFLSSAVLSVISPEGCASILFGDRSRAAEMARALRLRAQDLVALGIADGIIQEPPGGPQTDEAAAAAAVATVVGSALAELAVDADAEQGRRLVTHRRARIRRITEDVVPLGHELANGEETA
jgi:acetyl-CoA carboxylase carboxyl transferase beta subunit/acetyl-CoA carboxylase carboxyl transferase alpha subunit